MQIPNRATQRYKTINLATENTERKARAKKVKPLDLSKLSTKARKSAMAMNQPTPEQPSHGVDGSQIEVSTQEVFLSTKPDLASKTTNLSSRRVGKKKRAKIVSSRKSSSKNMYLKEIKELYQMKKQAKQGSHSPGLSSQSPP